MNQVIDRGLKVSLVIMVLISLFLSWKIWTKPANRSIVEKEKETSGEVIKSKKMTDVYAPTKLYYHKETDDFLYSNKETAIQEIHKKVTGFEFDSGVEIDKNKIVEVMYDEHCFSLFFPEEFPLAVYADIYNLMLDIPSKKTDFLFNRVLFALDENKIYFINHELTEGVAYDVSGDSDSLEKLLQDEKKNNYLPVSLTPDNIGGIYYLKDEVELKIYSYILATQSFTTYTKAFFNQPNDLYSNESDNVNLFNGEGESLSIQADTGEVNYFGKMKVESNKGDHSIYYNTFQYIENLGNTLGTFRYFDLKDNDIVYRDYIEGFPVFGNHMKGRLEVGVQNKNVFVRTNQDTIQIPIPADETVTLVPTGQLIDELLASGADEAMIEDIQIAYEWQANSETKQAVDLVPAWYVKYKDTWYPADELINNFQQGGND